LILRSSEPWFALKAYTQWLTSHSGAPNALEVLTEADRAYNWLINVGGSGDFFFGRSVPSSSTANELRRAGAAIRARSHH
jgi:hypothetical protein